MSSVNKKTNINKYTLKGGNNNLNPINNNQQKYLNNISHLKKDNQVNFPEINAKYNKLTPVLQIKHNNNNSQEKKIVENSKTSLSRAKKDNKMNEKYKLSKIISNDLTAKINATRLLDSCNVTNETFKSSQLNSFKLDANIFFDNLNKNNSINGKKYLSSRKTCDNINSNNDSYYNNNILNDNSTNHSNLESKRETHSCVKTEINDYYLKTPKDNNIKLVLPNKNFFDKKLIIKSDKNDLFNTPYGFITKNNDLLLANGSPEIKLKCPEELHFYYITVLQEGKKNEIEYEGE